jgi:hypothetical protein
MDIDGNRFLYDDRREEGAHSYFLAAGNEGSTADTEATLKLEATQPPVAVKQEPSMGADVKNEGLGGDALVKEEAREEAMQIG